MDFIQENYNDDVLKGAFPKQPLPPESADDFDNIRDSALLPRVGDEYQVEIPPVTLESECLRLKNGRMNGVILDDFSVGFPISLMWITEQVEDSNDDKIKREPLESENHDSSQDHCLELKFEPKDFQEPSNVAFRQEIIKRRGNRYRLVPGCVYGTWSDIEEDSFLLGLYIFGKNLVLVKNFVGSKRMGEILSFYYGRFYGSEKYRRWSVSRKLRNRKSIFGQKIFMGSRQQELLSRLRLHLSDECECAILKVSKTFTEGKLLLEEYVFALRDRVGLKALVEAVGIGKGKEDLTIAIADPVRTPVRPDIPSGKACSSLKPSEIVKFLTGGYRLSKAKSNDLFWEAVWPRLLARGWHSEQPSNIKHTLVYLVPGVKKFSRRNLVKGDQYFDSITDVLSKVASDPSLLELDYSSGEMNMNQGDDVDSQRRKCYLKPRSVNSGIDAMKFTIVDTSLARDGKWKVRELRSLPVDIRISEEEMCERSTDESGASDSFSLDRIHHNNEFRPTKMDCGRNRDSSSNGTFVVVGGSDKNNAGSKMQPRKNNIRSGTIGKRRRLSACSRIATTIATVRSQPEHDSPPSNLHQERLQAPPPQRMMLDLNLPLSVDNETEETVTQESTERQEQSNGNDNNNNVKPLRQSTRTRPLTAKALEALAFGFISPPTPKRKRKEDSPQSISNNNDRKHSHRAHSRVRVTENVNAGDRTPVVQAEEGEKCLPRENGDVVSELQD